MTRWLAVLLIGAVSHAQSQGQVRPFWVWKHLGQSGSILKLIQTADPIAYTLAARTVRKWDSGTGRQTDIFYHRNLSLSGMDFHAPTNRIAVSHWSGCQIWDGSTGQILQEVSQDGARAKHPQFSPDGNTVVFGGANSRTYVWNLQTGALQADWVGHHAVSFRADGSTLATVQPFGINFDVALRESQAWTVTKTLSSTSSAVAAAFAPTGSHIAVRYQDGSLKVWDADSAQVVASYNYGISDLEAFLEWSPDGRYLAIGSTTNPSAVFEVYTAVKVAILPSTATIAFSSDSQSVLSAGLGPVTETNLSNGQFARTWTPSGTFAMSPSGLLGATGYADGQIQLWNLPAGSEGAKWQAASAGISQLRFVDGGATLAALSNTGQLKLWSLPQMTLERQFDNVRLFDVSPDGNTLAVMDFNSSLEIRQVNRATGGLLGFFRNPSAVVDFKYSPNGQYLGSCTRDEIVVWNAVTRALLGSVPSVSAKRVAFSPDSSTFVVGGEEWCQLRRSADASLVWTKSEDETVSALAFAPDGKSIAVATTGLASRANGTLTFYSTQQGTYLTRFDEGVDGINELRYSNDGQFIAVVRGDFAGVVFNPLLGIRRSGIN